MREIQAILAIAKTTARDGLRAPVVGVVLACGLGLVLVAPGLAVFTLGNAKPFVLDLGASTALLATIFLAAVTAAWGSAERIADGTALLVLAQTSRFEYVAGTFLGAASVVALSGWILGIAVLHTAIPPGPLSGTADALVLAAALAAGARASRAQRGFQTTTIAALAAIGPLTLVFRGGPVEPALAGTAVAASALAVLAGLAYAALGVLLATRLPPALAASGTLAAAILGAASEGLASSEGAASALGAIAFVFPDLALFSVADAAYSERGISILYVGGVAIWTAAYALGALALGSALLGSRE